MTELTTHAAAMLATDCLRRLDTITAERDALLSAAESVVWFDWSDSDFDACAEMDRLREVCHAIRAKKQRA